ncbi:DinB family protein [Pseudonocardia xinjiangensis]|uniref:DinB family protein n=1 Tax=Pseudonocardia xinjiangensis TaxID=75289 RepID=A0ABX1RI38_9PSEU|nr:DinB family protein [Pseudonocardia xinjiangensis]NMH79129.1 DinB family protein [Pseudonocardia xinjiangensis]
MTWTSPAPAPAPGLLTAGPLTGAERPILESYLAHHRATLLRICAGLTGEQLAARPVPPSTLSLLGLVRHLAKVERIWLRQRVAGQDVPPLHGGPGNNTDFDLVDPARAEHEVPALCEEWRLGDEAVATVPLDHEFDFRGDPMSLRMVYVHLIGEYARHNGHADLLRQVLDGVTGR